MVRIYQTERGYFYKEYKNGKKVRISKKSAFKNMKGGYTPFTNAPKEFYSPYNNYSTKNDEIFAKYYLATQIRYDKPILDYLRPFGKFDELNDIYSYLPLQIKNIKNKYKNIPNKKVVGSSQYGIYFRLVKKELIDDYYDIYKSDDIDFMKSRSFLFDFDTFINYILEETKGIPLLWYTDFNAYGSERYGTVIQLRKKNKNVFLSRIADDIAKKMYEHEIVCRIPIPLNTTSGYIGKINAGILNFNRFNTNN